MVIDCPRCMCINYVGSIVDDFNRIVLVYNY